METTATSHVHDMVAEYLEKNRGVTHLSTQEILDSGAIPALKGFRIIPGKVSDSIVGGHVRYVKTAM